MSLFAPSAPKDEIYDLTPNSFVANWETFGGPSATKAQVRIVFPFSSTIKETGDKVTLDSPVPSGGDVVVSWADSGLATLAWGTVYSVEMRAFDGTSWSNWSPGTVFATNSAPRVPSGLFPNNGKTVTSLPMLTATASDTGLEPDFPLQLFAVIMESNGSVIATRPMSHVVAEAYGYQTTSSDLFAQGTYRWAAYSYDGHLYSGATTVESQATRSPSVSFEYDVAPTVQIISPADGAVLTSSTVFVDWTSTDIQASARVRVFDAITDELIYGKFDIQGNVTEWTVVDADIVDGGSYIVQVTTIDENNLGAIATAGFTVNYTPAASITGAAATTTTLGYDTDPTAVIFSWNPSLQTGDFDYYTAIRTPIDGPGGVVTGPPLRLGTVADIDQTTWLDAEGASGQWYRYGVIQTLTNGQISVAATAEAMVSFEGVILGAVTDPEGFHVDLYFSADNDEFSEHRFRPTVDFFLPLGAAKPLAYPGTQQTWDPSGEYVLLDWGGVTPAQRYRALVDLIERKATICYRDRRGKVVYVVCTDVQVTYTRIDRYIVALEFREIARDVEGAS